MHRSCDRRHVLHRRSDTQPDDGLYGGTDPNHNCGTLQYVRVEYAGFDSVARTTKSTRSPSAAAASGTVADHLQAIYGLDDTFEWFGGTMDAKYLVGGLGRDDYLPTSSSASSGRCSS